MLKIKSLRNTRVFQEGVEEGVEKGRQEGELRGRQLGQQEGRQLGQQEGRQLGQQEGRQAAAREILLRQLTLKFGSLDTQVISQIQAIADTEKLEQLADALINAPNLQIFLQNL